nr:hypothetical protein [Flavobacterium sp. ASV13]
MKFNKILVSKNAFESSEPYDLINSNISVINLLREEDVNDDDLHEDALISYYVDYYVSQYKNGNFSQFVWNTNWNNELNILIEEGLKKMGATKHLELFRAQSQKVESLSKEELNHFFENEYFGPNATRDKLKNDDFFTMDENIIKLNSKWLKNHPQLFVCSIDEMYAEIENNLGRSVNK